MAEASRRIDQRAEGWAGTVQEKAQGAAQNADQKATEAGAYVQDKLGSMDNAVRDYTGKPTGEWLEDVKSLMRDKPLMGAALMIGVGYALGKFMRW
jgi:hypothetical protein